MSTYATGFPLLGYLNQNIFVLYILFVFAVNLFKVKCLFTFNYIFNKKDQFVELMKYREDLEIKPRNINFLMTVQ
tara:strand:+ start:223 stop:447 length:225 start_codon:yes stop_codon:yes gene_type:complete